MRNLLVTVAVIAIVIVALFGMAMAQPVTTEVDHPESFGFQQVVWSNHWHSDVVEYTNYAGPHLAHRLHFERTNNGIAVTEFYSADGQSWGNGRKLDELITLEKYEKFCEECRKHSK